MKEAYPTLHAIGLGPQLAELDRICAQSQTGKHAGESIRDPGVVHHLEKAANHLGSSGVYPSERDPDSGALHLVHAAARLLMAAACVERQKDEHIMVSLMETLGEFMAWLKANGNG